MESLSNIKYCRLCLGKQIISSNNRHENCTFNYIIFDGGSNIEAPNDG